jgi:dihydrofolate synthase/folylpolyglutamate synthase
MSYAAAIEQLNSMVPELHSSGSRPKRKFSLEEVRTLLGELSNPERAFPSVLIAGTNGKGSTAATLASVLSAAGLRVGLYTSPHLVCVNERIRVGAAEIEDEAFGRLYFKVHQAAERLVERGELGQMPSFFEVLTAIAFCCFAEHRVQIAVLEVGMGGRLDATNVVDPLLSIVTDISLDHTEWLGPTIAAIAREKAGILRREGTLITLPQHPDANQVLGEVALELSVRGVSAAGYMPPQGTVGAYPLEVLGKRVEMRSPLTGEHQQRNLALAVAAAVELAQNYGFTSVTPVAIEQGIRNTRWPGRMELVEAWGQEWILDVAHNPAGAWALRAGLRTIMRDDTWRALVFSCLHDKPVRELAQILFPLFEKVILAPIHSARAASLDEMTQAALATGSKCVATASVEEALQLARDSSDGRVIVVSGSVYLIGEVKSLLSIKKGGAR